MESGCWKDISHPAQLCMWETKISEGHIQMLLLQTKAPLGDSSPLPPRLFGNAPINSVRQETEEREETGYVDEWTQTFTDIKIFGLAVYLKRTKIFRSQLCRTSSDTKINEYVYVKQVFWGGTPADLCKIWSWLDFWTCWRKNRKQRPINKSDTSMMMTGWRWFFMWIIWIFLGTLVLLFMKL